MAAIQAINEPIMDATLTPGLGDCKLFILLSRVVQIIKWITRIDYKNFVQTVRAVEQSLGIYDPLSKVIPTSENEQNFMNATQAIATTATLSSLNPEVCKVLQQAVPIILQIASDLGINLSFKHDGLGSSLPTSRPLVTKYVLNSELSWHNVLTILQFYGCRLAI